MKTFNPVVFIATVIHEGKSHYLSPVDNAWLLVNTSMTFRDLLKNNYVLTDKPTFDALQGMWDGSVVAVVDGVEPSSDLQVNGYGIQYGHSFESAGEAYQWLLAQATRTGDPTLFVIGEQNLVNYAIPFSKDVIIHTSFYAKRSAVNFILDDYSAEFLKPWNQLWSIPTDTNRETSYGRANPVRPLSEF